MATDANKGKVALDNRDYSSAITHLSAALKTSQAPLWLLQRSTAYHRSKQHKFALADANNAVLAAISRGKRELIAEAQFRRAISLYGLKQYGDARLCLTWCTKYNPKQQGLTMWLAKIKKDYDSVGGDEADCNAITVKEIPDKIDEVEVVEQTNIKNVKPCVGKTQITSAIPATPQMSRQTSKEKIRHEWYQTPSIVTIEFFAKSVPKDNLTVVIQEGTLEVSFPVNDSHTTYDFTITPLFSKIDTNKSSFRVTPHKIELVLHKATPGLKWSSLEGTELIVASEPAKSIRKNPEAIISNSEPIAKAPIYPTSSRTGPKNWDNLAEDEPEDDHSPDDFFKSLYQKADPDMKRAMMKSYQESNGTSLSTDWADVGSRKVETVPPTGVEAKPWSS